MQGSMQPGCLPLILVFSLDTAQVYILCILPWPFLGEREGLLLVTQTVAKEGSPHGILK